MKRPFLPLAGCAAFLFAACLNSTANTTNLISFGEISSGSIPGPAVTIFYTFTGNSNNVVTAALLRTNGTGNPYLYLYDPMTNLVFQGGGTSIVTHKLRNIVA